MEEYDATSGAPPGEKETERVTSDPVIDDPVGTLFTAPGLPQTVTEESDMPEDVRALFESEGLYKKSYSVMLKELPEGIDDGRDMYLESFRSKYPDTNYLGLHYGPGTYKLLFMWDKRDEETGKKKKVSDHCIIRISEKFRPKFKEFQRRERIRVAEVHNEELRSAKIAKSLEDDLSDAYPADQKQSAKDYVSEIVENSRMLGLTNRGPDWESILKIAVPLIPAVLTMISTRSSEQQRRQDDFTKLLVTIMSGNNNQMLDIMKSQKQPTTGTGVMEEMTKMVMASLDLKGALEGQKETVADKIFAMIENVAPKVMEIAAMSAQQRAMNPMANATVVGAQAYMGADPNFQQMSKDPAVFAEVVSKLDAHYGWKQTDSILMVMKKERPAECPRLPENENPAEAPEETPERAEMTGEEGTFSDIDPLNQDGTI